MQPTHSAGTETGHSRDYAAVALEYASDAAADKKGKRYCKWVRLAAKRHLNDLKKFKKVTTPYIFDEWHANDACDFIEKLPHVEGSWDSKHITLEPAQIFIICVVFGWRRRRDGRRRFTRVYIEMARKNAKSTLTAGIALYCLCCEGEVGPQILIGATTGDQAGKVFNPAKLMVEKTPDLRAAFQVQAWSRSVTCGENGGFIQPINAKSSTQDGWNPHCGILDEVHAHKDRGLFDVIRSAFGARKNPLLWMITTAGYNTLGVCYEQRTLVTKLLEALVEDDTYFGIIFTLDEGDSPFDETKWGKANPLLGVSVQLDELRGYAIEAKNSPASLGEFQTKRLNVWTSAKDGHVNITLWKKCNGEVDLDELRTIPCWGGLDLANKIDMAAFRLVWQVDKRVKTWGRFYLPEGTVKPRSERGNVPYQVWAKQGLLTVTEGDVIDYDYIKSDVLWAMKNFDLRAIGYDPWNAQATANDLMREDVPMIEYRQGIPSFNAPMKELDRLYTARLLDHEGDPILAWNASNIVARKDVNDNIAPDRSTSTEKIDGYVAMLMALGLMLRDAGDGPSVYETRGLVEIEV